MNSLNFLTFVWVPFITWPLKSSVASDTGDTKNAVIGGVSELLSIESLLVFYL